MTGRLAERYGEHADRPEGAEEQHRFGVAADRRVDRLIIVDEPLALIPLKLCHDVAMHQRTRAEQALSRKRPDAGSGCRTGTGPRSADGALGTTGSMAGGTGFCARRAQQRTDQRGGASYRQARG